MPRSRIILWLTTLISVVMVFAVFDLDIDYDLENLFPQDDPELAFFREFRERYASENDYLSVGIYHANGLFETEFLQKLDQLCQDLKALDAVLDEIDDIARATLGAVTLSTLIKQMQRGR